MFVITSYSFDSYEEEFNTRRDHRKLKPGLSRSRDNFDLGEYI